jgi:8-oxo-dGTP diphosphatase
VGEVCGVLDRVIRDGEGRIRYHWVLVDYVAFPESGTLCAASDADGAQWVEVDQVERLDTTDGLMDMIRRAQAVAERNRP